MKQVNRPIRYLLIEDDDDHADLVIRALNEGCDTSIVTHLHDGEDAMAFLERCPPFESEELPDIILLDLNLPRMRGHQLLTTIKATPQFRSIPVVVLTTSSAEGDRLTAYESHANSYLVKPVDLDRFEAMINDVKRYWSVWNQPPT